MKSPHVTTFDDLLSVAATLPETRVVVASPANAETYNAVRAAAESLPVQITLVGDDPGIERESKTGSGWRGRVEAVRRGGIADILRTCTAILSEPAGGVLLKGSVDTATLMRAVLEESAGLRTGRLLSDVFLFEYRRPAGTKLVMITDGGLIPAPDLTNKVELIRNAVEVAHALGSTMPKVAVLSASEFVTPSIPSTLDAAILAKMNERGQISGCLVDGPLALDNAISADAAREKGIRSSVAGDADILIAANIEAANSLAKSTTLFAGYRLAHVIVGARVPICIPSRADRSDAKLLSIALGVIMNAGKHQ
jgi:phosphotransacetylase